jgi:DNA-binding NtrC family response regulator
MTPSAVPTAAIHVLVAGGEPELRRNLVRVLESRGMRVGVVEGGPQALDYLAKTPPDVALVGGPEVLTSLEASGAPCEVIPMTAFVDVESAAAHAVEKAVEHRRLLLSKGQHDPTRGMLADLARLPYTEAKRRLLSLFDETYTAEVLRCTGGNMSEAARRAGLDRSNFRRLLKRQASPARDEASPARDEEDEP